MNNGPLDFIPLWTFVPLAMAISLIALEAGYRLGKWRHARAVEEKDAPVAAMAAAVLGLLAFMLAFTFSLAASRFDARRQSVLEEANAIGTTYLRARLLPEPERSDIEELLRRYTQLRAQTLNPDGISDVLKQSEAIHEQLWSHAVTAAEKNNGSIMTSLFLESLNETIDLHAKRVYVGLYSRIPVTIWLVLFVLILLGMAAFGYHSGIAATQRSLGIPIFTLAFAAVLYLIFDLDRAHEGVMQISQQAMIDLRDSMLDLP